MKAAEPLYQQAILLLEEHMLGAPEAKLRQAQALLEQAVASNPRHARSHAALGHAYDLQEGPAAEALACLREARRLNPKDKIAEAYVLTLLAELGPEKEALAAIRSAAPRHGVDLTALRRELARARFPADAYSLVINGFIRARNFYRSWLADEAERIRNRREPGRAHRAATERQQCLELQRELESHFDLSRVPDELRALAGWAVRYGVGDDVCRPYLMKRLTKKQKGELIRAVDEHAEAMQRWLDTFEPGGMSNEAAALMYLAEGVEEIRPIDG